MKFWCWDIQKYILLLQMQQNDATVLLEVWICLIVKEN